MGFFKSLGKGLNNFGKGVGETLFGTESKKEANKQSREAGKKTEAVGTAAQKLASGYNKQAGVYDTQTEGNLGTSAADYMSKQNAAAEVGAQAQGMTAALQGSRAALKAARTAGLNKGQAALTAGQNAGDIYTDAYGTGMESGRQNYAQGTQMQSAQGAELASRGQNAMNTQLGAATGQANIAGQNMQSADNKSARTWGTIGTLAGAGATLAMSDERAKDDISVIRSSLDNYKAGLGNKMDVMDIAEKVDPVSFEYKDGIVESGKAPPGEQMGVIAQDLEKTPLASAVKTGEDGLKRIDTSELSPAVLNLVIQLAQKVKQLEEKTI